MLSVTSSWKTRLRHVAMIPVLLAGVVGAIVAAANPASAAVPGLVRIVATSAPSPNDKSVVAACPGGKQLTGTGVAFGAAFGEVIMDDLVPLSNPGRVRVRGVEDLNLATNWTATAYAICASKQIVQVTRTSAPSPINKSKTANCPAGTQLTGAGADLGNTGNEVLISAITPTANSVTVFAEVEDATNANWTVSVTAFCAPVSTIVVTAVSPPVAANAITASVAAVCPPGTQVTGTGGEITGGGGSVGMNSIVPNAALTGVAVKGTEVDPTNANWIVKAHAICAW